MISQVILNIKPLVIEWRMDVLRAEEGGLHP
jgi:hypothetical protein